MRPTVWMLLKQIGIIYIIGEVDASLFYINELYILFCVKFRLQ